MGEVFRQIYVGGRRGRRARSELLPQGGPEGAVDVADAESVTIADDRFRDLGGSAIHLGPSTRDIRLVRNEIHDGAGRGIFVGGWSLISGGAPPSCCRDKLR